MSQNLQKTFLDFSPIFIILLSKNYYDTVSLHGLTDALWIHDTEISTEKVEALLEKIEKRTRVPISLEGIYHWIVFLPSKVQPERSVANRYFGLFKAGTVKIRGIACCCRDTPAFIKEAQKNLLLILSTAQDRPSLNEQIPAVLDRLGEYVACLKEGRVDSRDLVITRRVGKVLDEYKVNTPTAQVLQELEGCGVTLYPGQRLGYLLREEPAVYWPGQKVTPDLFLNGGEGYDSKKYLTILLKASHEILITFNYNIKC